MEETNQLIGLTGVPTIMSIVNWLKELGLPSKVAPVASLTVGIVINVLLAFLLGNELREAVVVGLVAGFVASGWYDLKNIGNGK